MSHHTKRTRDETIGQDQVAASERIGHLCQLSEADLADEPTPTYYCGRCWLPKTEAETVPGMGDEIGLRVCFPPCKPDLCEYCEEPITDVRLTATEGLEHYDYCSSRCADAADYRRSVLAEQEASEWRSWLAIEEDW